jgi:predicted Zn-dependent protease with MMP-like domain
MTRERFRHLVSEAIDTIPIRFRRELQNIAIVVEDRPSRALLEDMEIEPPSTLFGLYQGTPLTERRWDHGNVLPDRIAIFQEPIEDVSESEEDIVTEVGETLIHEVGHYFGLSEDELEDIEDRYWHRRTEGCNRDGEESTPDEQDGRDR